MEKFNSFWFSVLFSFSIFMQRNVPPLTMVEIYRTLIWSAPTTIIQTKHAHGTSKLNS